MLDERDLNPDPVLSNIAMEFGVGGGFAYEQAVPERTVTKESFKYAKWDIGKFVTSDTDTRRAPGAGANIDTDASLTFHTGVVETHAIKQYITAEMRREAPTPESLVSSKIKRIVQSLRRAKEIKFRDLIQDTGTCASAVPGVKWDAAANVVIEANIDAAKEAFLLQCGFEATHIVIPPLVKAVMKRDSTLRGLRKFSDERLLTDGELPELIFGLRPIVPGAVRNANAPGVAPALSRIWSADKVSLLYVDFSAASDPTAMTAVQAFGYQDAGFSYPTVSWSDPDLSSKKTWYAVETSWMMEMVASCVYILDDVLT